MPDLAHVIRDAFKTFGRQGQAVEHCLAQAIVTRVGQILFVGEQDLLRLCFQIISDFFQNAVFLAAGKERQFVKAALAAAPICSSMIGSLANDHIVTMHCNRAVFIAQNGVDLL